MSKEIRREFDAAMVDIYKVSAKDIGYRPTRFLEMVSEMGGIAAAERLIRAARPSDGFTRLWEEHRLDLTVEALVVTNQRFHCLFSPEDVAAARERLANYGWQDPKAESDHAAG